jgi:hypothetical protein
MHKLVKKAYQDADFDVQQDTADILRKNFELKTQRGNGQTRKRINQVWRVKPPGQKRDYIVYEYSLFADDMIGNEHSITEHAGKAEYPRFSQQYDNETGKVSSSKLARTETVYYIPWTKSKMQEILDSANLQSQINFTLDAGHTKYGDFTAYDFTERHFDDLLEKARTGKFPDPPRELPDEAQVQAEHEADLKARNIPLLEEETVGGGSTSSNKTIAPKKKPVVEPEEKSIEQQLQDLGPTDIGTFMKPQQQEEEQEEEKSTRSTPVRRRSTKRSSER